MIRRRQNDNTFIGCGAISVTGPSLIGENGHYVPIFIQSFGPVTDIDPIIYIYNWFQITMNTNEY